MAYMIRSVSEDGSMHFRRFERKLDAEMYYATLKRSDARRIGWMRCLEHARLIERDLGEEDFSVRIENERGRILATFGHWCDARAWMDRHGMRCGEHIRAQDRTWEIVQDGSAQVAKGAR